jgi:hypothetical protein
VSRKVTFFIIPFTLFAVFALGLAVLWRQHYLTQDKYLLRMFWQKRAVLEKLNQMALQDATRGSYFSGNETDSSLLPRARTLEYQRLLAEVQKGLVVTIDKDNVVRFIFLRGGLLTISPGWAKGIEYIPNNYEKEGIVLQSLDTLPSNASDTYLRPIESHWFIFYQKTD